MFATIAPVFEAQKKRLDEQEEKQALFTRKVQILEGGFQTLQDMLDNQHTTEPVRSISSPTDMDSEGRNVRHTFYIDGPTESILSEPGSDVPNAAPPSGWTVPNFDTASIEQQLPIQSNDSESSPWASPYHHLLYLHENLREEVARVASSLNELDGRHSTAIVNETMRIKEDLAHLGGQVGGLSRQVGWLASTRLQQGYGSRMSSVAGSVADSEAQGQAGPSEAGASAAARFALGRRVTDEGRTKL